MKLSLTGLLTIAVLGSTLTSSVAFADGYGDAKGQFILKGDIPKLPPLVKKGDPAAKDPEVCAAQDVADESLVVDEKSKGIANIVLFMSRAPRDIKPELAKVPTEPAVQDQKGCQFLPHVMVMRAGQPANVKSNDGCAHNVRSSFIRNAAFNVTVQANDREGVTFEEISAPEPLPMPIKCDIHPYMSAYWVIADHPYVAVTDKDGNFEIKGLPEGNHTFRVWHERPGYIDRSFKIKVEADKVTDLGTVEVNAADVEKK